ncbi:hypothetical protein PMZ80_005603 [Knufia obscura]|uniref:Uncharacterized protein n=2 Tax=Knufia TaxID=430999 RepID=A0AAN8F0P4_9EURO|nr:hypothetical protein PMZ80_005603 [Knufia obscura]KAK5949361.1 hypothetical protein OHC33_009533 [Knufia fluminis]
MTSTLQCPLAALPVEIRTYVFEQVFEGQQLRLKSRNARGSTSLGNLSILVTSKFFNKDPVIRDVLHQKGILVLKTESDWLRLMDRCFENGTFDSSKFVKRITWKVSDQVIHAKRSFFQKVTPERLAQIFLTVSAVEIQLNQTQHICGTHETLSEKIQSPTWMGIQGQWLANNTLCNSENRRNVQYQDVLSVLQEVFERKSHLDLTLKVPILIDCKSASSNWTGSGWRTTSIIHDGIMNLKDCILRIDMDGRTHEIQQHPFLLWPTKL